MSDNAASLLAYTQQDSLNGRVSFTSRNEPVITCTLPQAWAEKSSGGILRQVAEQLPDNSISGLGIQVNHARTQFTITVYCGTPEFAAYQQAAQQLYDTQKESMTSQPIADMHSNTQRQLEAYQFATKPGHIMAHNAQARIITISGLTPREGAQQAVETMFGAHFAASDMQVSITPPPADAAHAHFHVALSGAAYADMLEGETAQHEIDDRKPGFSDTVMARRAFAASKSAAIGQ